jgi:hypothetical protein
MKPHGAQICSRSHDVIGWSMHSCMFVVYMKQNDIDQVTWVIHEGGFLFIIYHNCEKSSPIR